MKMFEALCNGQSYAFKADDNYKIKRTGGKVVVYYTNPEHGAITTVFNLDLIAAYSYQN